MKIIEGHSHSFDKNDIAHGALGSKCLYYFVNKHTIETAKVLHNIIPLTDKDVFDDLKNFIRYESQTQLQKITALKKSYEVDTQIVILTINQHYLEAGKVNRKYEDQLKELVALKQAGEDILIYFFAEPRDPENFDLLLKYEKYIAGLKMYPNWGYFPYDSRLDKYYKWCEDNNKSVVFHCTPETPIYYRGKDLEYLLNEGFYQYNKDWSNKRKCGHFADPRGVVYVAKKYSKVLMSMAHMGSKEEVLKYAKYEKSWTHTILEACKTLPNVYTDISFCSYDDKVLSIVKKLMQDPILKYKILYGSDFYMNSVFKEQKEFYENVKDIIGSFAFNQMAKINNDLFYNR